MVRFLLSLLSPLSVVVFQADQVNYYQVAGRTAADVRAAMNRVRPTGAGGGRFDAWTTWDIKWRYRYNPAPAGCAVTSFDATLTTAMTLPKWTDYAAAPAALQRQWSASYAALLVHERGHIRIGELAVGAIRAAGPRITASKCSEIGALIDKKGNELLAEYKRKEVQYDVETNHGVKQGAKFP